MTFKLWNFYDSFDIENLISRNNFNKVKVVLYSLDEGYEVFLRINDKEESMFFTYQDTRVLDSLDHGLLPTAILSGICQAKEQYLYSNYVIVEVFDRRSIQTNELSCQDQFERKHITILRITDNNIVKLTGIKSRLGDVREEQHWLSRKSARLDLNATNSTDSDDGLGFIGTEWFQTLVRRQHVSSVLHRKRQANWDSNEDGPFRPSRLPDIMHCRLRAHLQANLLGAATNTRSRCTDVDGLRTERLRVEVGDEMMEKIRKLLEFQKQSIFKFNPSPVIKYNDCHEECVHQMIIRSPLSGSNFKLILSRCSLHNRHWGHLVVDQWEGSSTKPIRFELPGGYGQGRRLLNQLSEMLGARISMNTELNTVSDSSASDQNISPKQPETQSSLKCISNDTIWESIESIMTKNIQSGKPLYDNRDHSSSSMVLSTADGESLCKKKKSSLSNSGSKSKLSNPNLSTETAYQTSSKKNSLLKVGSMSGELQQKQSLYSLKDLNLDDLF